jgi:hypothetical protein
LDDDRVDDDVDELEVEEDDYDEVEGDVDNDDSDEGRAIEDEAMEVAEEEDGEDDGCAEGLRGDAAVPAAASTLSTNTADRDLDAELEEIYNKVTGDTEAEGTTALGKHGRDENSTSSSSTSGSSLLTTQTKFVKATKTPVMQKCRPSTPWILKSL